MKKLFLTSGLVLCMACPALAGTLTYNAGDENTPESFVTANQNNPTPDCSYPDTLNVQTGSTTFYAKWKPATYHVIYAGGSAGNHAVMSGTTYSTDIDYLASYTVRDNTSDATTGLGGTPFDYDGYHFKEWKANWDFSTPTQTPTSYDPTDSGTYKVTGDVTMTAQWNPNLAHITFDNKRYDANGQNGVSPNTSVGEVAGTAQVWTRFEHGVFASSNTDETWESATPITTITSPSMTGYTFKGYWTTIDNTGTQYVNAATTPDSETVNIINNLDQWKNGTTGNIEGTLYAHWDANGYKLKYRCGSFVRLASQDLAALNKTADYKSGHGEGTTSYTGIDYTYDAVGNAALAVTDVCELAGYHPNFLAANDENYASDQTFGTGWRCVKDGTNTPIDIASFTAGNAWTIDGDVTCTAQWTPNEIGLTWKVGVDAEASTDTGATSCTYDEGIGIEGVPERPGYVFEGWSTTAQVDVTYEE